MSSPNVMVSCKSDHQCHYVFHPVSDNDLWGRTYFGTSNAVLEMILLSGIWFINRHLLTLVNPSNYPTACISHLVNNSFKWLAELHRAFLVVITEEHRNQGGYLTDQHLCHAQGHLLDCFKKKFFLPKSTLFFHLLLIPLVLFQEASTHLDSINSRHLYLPYDTT